MTNHKKLYRKIAPYVNFKYDLRRKLTPGQKAAITRAANKLIPELKFKDTVTIRRLPGETPRAYAIRRNRIARQFTGKIIQGNKILIQRLPEGAKYRFSNGKPEIIGSRGQLVAKIGGFKLHHSDDEKTIREKVRALMEANSDAKSAAVITRKRGVSMKNLEAAIDWLTNIVSSQIQKYQVDEHNPEGIVSVKFYY